MRKIRQKSYKVGLFVHLTSQVLQFVYQVDFCLPAQQNLQKSAQNARQNATCKVAKKCNGDGPSKALYACLGKVDSGDVEHRFATAHDYRCAVANVTIRAVSIVYVGQNCQTSTTGKGPNQKQFQHLLGYAHKLKWRADKVHNELAYTTCAQGIYHQKGSKKIGKNSNHSWDGLLGAIHKTVVDVYPFETGKHKKCNNQNGNKVTHSEKFDDEMAKSGVWISNFCFRYLFLSVTNWNFVPFWDRQRWLETRQVSN